MNDIDYQLTLRGLVLYTVLKNGPLTTTDLLSKLSKKNPEKVQKALDISIANGHISRSADGMLSMVETKSND